jgi:hypothetical protein
VKFSPQSGCYVHTIGTVYAKYLELVLFGSEWLRSVFLLTSVFIFPLGDTQDRAGAGKNNHHTMRKLVRDTPMSCSANEFPTTL